MANVNKERHLRLRWFAYTSPLRWAILAFMFLILNFWAPDLFPIPLIISLICVWCEFLLLLRIANDHRILKSGIITKGIIRSCGFTLFVPFARWSSEGTYALWVAYAVVIGTP